MNDGFLHGRWLTSKVSVYVKYLDREVLSILVGRREFCQHSGSLNAMIPE